MTTVPNVAYIGAKGTLLCEADNYTAAVTAFTLTPTADKASVTDIGGGVQQFAGTAAWVAGMTYNQDWTTVNSLSQKLIEWHGQRKTFTYTPEDGGLGWTITVVCEAGVIGGPSKAVHQATVNLGVIDQPEPVPPTPPAE